MNLLTSKSSKCQYVQQTPTFWSITRLWCFSSFGWIQILCVGCNHDLYNRRNSHCRTSYESISPLIKLKIIWPHKHRAMPNWCKFPKVWFHCKTCCVRRLQDLYQCVERWSLTKITKSLNIRRAFPAFSEATMKRACQNFPFNLENYISIYWKIY